MELDKKKIMANINGTAGDDLLNGTTTYDSIYGLAGNDTLNASDGNDSLDGGRGNDDIYGDAGNDYIYDIAVADSIVGDAGYDRLHINLSAISTPLTINYTNPTGGTTSGGGSIDEEVEHIDFRGGTGYDNINTSAATYSLIYGGAGDDTLTTTRAMD